MKEREVGLPRPEVKKRKTRSDRANKWLQITTGEDYGYEIPSAIPAGWVTLRSLSKEIQVTGTTVKKYAVEMSTSDNAEESLLLLGRFQTSEGIRDCCSPELYTRLKEMLDVGPPPEGWLSVGPFAQQLETTVHTVRRIIDRSKLNESYQGGFSLHKTGKGKITTYISPEVQSFVKDEISRFVRAPEGWETRGDLRMRLGITQRAMDVLIEESQQKEDAQIKLFKNKRGRIAEHISPDFASSLEKKAQELKKTALPDGWMTNNQVAAKFSVTHDHVRKIADRYRIGKGERNNEFENWFRTALSSSGQVREHYSPELIAIIEKELARKEIPVGWKNSAQLGKQFGISYKTIRKIARRLVSDSDSVVSEDLKEIDRKDGVYEYYSPRLISLIEQELSLFEVAPKGWKTMSTLTKELKVSQEALGKITDPFRPSQNDQNSANERMFGLYRRPAGVFEHFSPELVSLVMEDIESRKGAPEGWLKISEIRKKLKVSHRNLSPIVDSFRPQEDGTNSEFAEHIGLFRDVGVRLTEYFSPELIDKITDRLIESYKPHTAGFPHLKRRPDGWFSVGSLAKSLGSTHPTIKKISDRFKTQFPENFQSVDDGRKHTHVYFSPKIANLIEKEYNSIERVPDGWMTRKNIAEQTEFGQHLVSSIVDRAIVSSDSSPVKLFRGPTGNISEYLPPEIVQRVMEELNARETAPVGWNFPKAIAHDLGTNGGLVRKVANQYRTNHPEWFKPFRIHSGHTYEHYAPELVELIALEVPKRARK